MWRDAARVGEAALLLTGALLLIRFIRFAHWSRLFRPLMRAADRADEATALAVAVAVGRAQRRLLRRSVKCLPRAMAAQWMLRRRGVASRLVIGGAAGRAGARVGEFHAWIECAGAAADIGRADAATFTPIMTLGYR